MATSEDEQLRAQAAFRAMELERKNKLRDLAALEPTERGPLRQVADLAVRLCVVTATLYGYNELRHAAPEAAPWVMMLLVCFLAVMFLDYLDTRWQIARLTRKADAIWKLLDDREAVE